jgi:hypothetical protein
MQKLKRTLGNILFLLKPWWKYGKLYMLGNLALALFCAPVIAFIDVTLIQAVIDAISASKTLTATLRIALTYVVTRLSIQL